jgi:ABC-2 type transport system permease protein
MLLSQLLTGFIYPRDPMPPVIRAVGNLIPLTYFIRIARGIITKGVGISFLWNDVFALTIYGILVMVLAAVTFKKRLD